MTDKQFEYRGVKFDCNCHCHRIGLGVMHCFPCCGLCYVKYLNKDGSFNQEMFEQVVDKIKGPV